MLFTRHFLCFLISFFFLIITGKGQALFPEKCLGIWEGTLMIYAESEVKDSVAVIFTVMPIEDGKSWIWKTEYLSEQFPMVKDYRLILKDAAKQIYDLDEGNEIILENYGFGNKLYCVFETHDLLLTSSYELVGEQLVFEVTSGKSTGKTGQDVGNYAVKHLQRVVMTRKE